MASWDPPATTGSFYVQALEDIAGPAIGGFAVICLIASLILAMNTSTADGGRALYGIARDDMTIKWLYHLNKFHVPARGMTVDMVVNIGLLLLLGANNFVILYISNIGYVFCHVLALTGFLLLRRDRPDWPRPIKVGPIMTAAAWLLAAFNLILVLAGVVDQKVASYIGFYEFKGLPLFLGAGVLVVSVLLFFYRRAVQDKKPITFRDPDVADDAERGADASAPRGGHAGQVLVDPKDRWSATGRLRRPVAVSWGHEPGCVARLAAPA